MAFAPDVVLCPGNYLDPRFPGLKIQLFHGVGIEKPSHYVIRDFFDYYFTSGPLVTERFQALARQHTFFEVIETGWPKFDHILHYPTNHKLPLLPNSASKKVILFAPTFSRTMQSAEAILPILPQLIRKDEVWLMKFHELMPTHFKELVRQIAPNQLILIEQEDITPYLHLADVLLSDTSSVVYEFLSLEKPVLTFRTLAYEEKALNITELSEVRPALDRLLADPQLTQQASRQMLLRVNPYLDGQISARIIGTLDGLVRSRARPKTKPLNLFRKAKVLYYYYFKRGVLL
jgi:CDP-glycerol glycerophosphotransferase (TagB/SpsB family)